MLFAQSITDAADAAGKVTEAGFVAILVFFLLLIGLGCAAVAWRLFGKGGIADRLATAHTVFLDRMAASAERTASAVEGVENANQKIESHVVKIMLRGSSQQEQIRTFARMWKHQTTISREMAKKIGAFELVSHEFDKIDSLIEALLLDALPKTN